MQQIDTFFVVFQNHELTVKKSKEVTKIFKKICITGARSALRHNNTPVRFPNRPL